MLPREVVEQTAAAVERLLAELQEVKFRAAQLEEQLYAAEAEKFAGAGEALLIRPPMAPDAARRLADAVAKSCGGLTAVFAGKDGEKYNYALIHPAGADIAPTVKAMNAALSGRGGGRNGFAQGSLQATEAQIRAFWAEK